MSAKLKEYREQQARIATEARSHLDEADKATDPARRAELIEMHDKAMADYDRLEKLIEREQKLAEIEKRAEERDSEARSRQRPLVDTERRGVDDQQNEPAKAYRSAFAKYVCGVDLSSEEQQVLRSGFTRANFSDPEARAQTAGTTTAGGFTVPVELANMIIKSMKAWGPMYDEAICTEMVTSGGQSIKVPTIDDTANTGVAHTEATALTDDGSADAVFGQKSLDAFAFDTKFIKWSWELEMDSIFSMESLLSSLLGERLGRLANVQLTTGSGSSAPNGIVTASSLGKTTASASAVTWDEIIDLEHSVDPAYRTSPKARYMFNDSTLQASRKLKDGQGNYLWQMGDVTKGVPASFNGRPYSINQAMASIGTGNKFMLFGDFSKYYVRKVGAPIIGVLRERFWPDLGIAGLIRFDGELGDTAAVKHMKNA